MKYIKTYEELTQYSLKSVLENNENNPKIGDYVKISGDVLEEKEAHKSSVREELIEFFDNYIGQVTDIEKEQFFGYRVEFDNLIPVFLYKKMMFAREEIEYFSSDKETLEAILIGKKYNL